MEEKVIFSKDVAYKLRKQGFHLKYTTPNPYKPEFDCYVFQDSPYLAAALTDIVKAKKLEAQNDKE